MFNRKLKKEIAELKIKITDLEHNLVDLTKVEIPYKGVLVWNGESLKLNVKDVSVGELLKSLIKYLGLEAIGMNNQVGFLMDSGNFLLGDDA